MIEITQIGGHDYVGWPRGFRTLAVQQGRPLLQAAGVPDAIARAPDALSRIARDYVLASQHHHVPPGGSYMGEVLRVVRNTFAELAVAYSRDDAVALRDWLIRHFLEEKRRSVIVSWVGVLRSLIDDPRTPSPLPPPVQEGFIATVQPYFGRQVTIERRRLEQVARSIPISAEERELLRIDAADDEGNYPSYADPVTALVAAMRVEAAYAVWRELNSWMDPVAREVLLGWAREEYGMMGFTPERLTIPGSSEPFV